LGPFFSASFKKSAAAPKSVHIFYVVLAAQSQIFMTGKKNLTIVREAYNFFSAMSRTSSARLGPILIQRPA
jgi:hypothetical protein